MTETDAGHQEFLVARYGFGGWLPLTQTGDQPEEGGC